MQSSCVHALLDEVLARHEHVVITRNGRPAGVLLSPDDWESVQETLEVLADADLMEALRQSAEHVRAGRLESLADVQRRLGRG